MENTSHNTFVAVAVSTGTKCLNGEYISHTGTVVQDCHAEVLARRRVQAMLYEEIKLIPNSTVLDKISPSGYKIRDNIKFHLYVSSAPCGDARIFSPHETEEDEDSHPNRESRGILRTKIEAGEGTIPCIERTVQTFDGILAGERLLTMSCADKLCRWNVTGLQGSLLSLYLQPVYYSSIILGSLFHAEHLARAVYKRVGPSKMCLPAGYEVNKPVLSVISSPETRVPGKAPNFAVHWGTPCVSSPREEKPEILNTSTGKPMDVPVSVICKQAMFKRFHQLRNEKIPSRVPMPVKLPTTYDACKVLAGDFQRSKETLALTLMKAGLGFWTKKPQEVNDFSLK